MAHITPPLLSLPPELIEEIIIVSALLGDTRIAATLSQTCRPFRILVYHQSHKHLWREMFLIVFDDPRPARDLRTHGRAPRHQLDPNNKGKGKFKSCHDFPWEDEYKLRIWTEAFIPRRTRRALLASPSSSRDALPDPPTTDAELCVVLETLLRVILTATPLPYNTLVCIASHSPTCSPPHPHPVFPPLFVAAHTQPALVLVSRNTTWLTRVLAYGLPCVLMARLTAFNENGDVNIQKTPVEWDGLLAKLVAQIGLMTPVSSTPCAAQRPPHMVLVAPFIAGSGDAGADASGSGAAIAAMSIITDEAEGDDDDGDGVETRDGASRTLDAYDLSDDDDDPDFEPQSEGESDEENESEINGDEVLGTMPTPATIQQDGVRRLARVRVYNMAYLHPSRAFGPFLPLDACRVSTSPTTQKLGSGAAEEEEESDVMGSPPTAASAPPVPQIPGTSLLLRALGRVHGFDIEDAGFWPLFDDDDGDNDDDDDYRDADGSSVSSPSPHEDSNAPASLPSPVAAVAASSSAGRMRPPKEILRDQLRFDWAWISAARQVIELNLRDLLADRHQGVLRALLSLEGLRSCSAPGFPDAAPPEVPVVAEDGESEGRGPVFEDGEGWDWAGVEGQWRCVIGAPRRLG